MDTVKTICILGGGVGGVVAANRLKKSLGAAARVVLIDKSADHVFQPSFLNVMIGKRQPEQIKRSLALLTKKGIEFINRKVKEILPSDKKIRFDDREIDFDYLIIALGAQSNMGAVEGLEAAAINLYSLEGALEIKEAIEKFSSGEVVILIPSMPYKCPAAPYETAFLLEAEFARRKVRDKVNISIYTFEPAPMPTAGPQVGKAIMELLRSRGINYYPQVGIASVDPATGEVVFSDGTSKIADLLITVPPHKAPEVVKSAGLTNEAGWIPVDRKTLSTGHDGIYALGDVTAVKLEGMYKPDKPLMLPKAGVMAHHEAEVVAANIAADIRGSGKRREFDGKGSCFLELGDGTAGYAAGSFFDLPHPDVKMRKPARRWHWYKILFEKYWFRRWF